MDYMYKKAHCLEEFGFKYRRHGYYDPLFRLYVRGCELWTKFWKSPAPLSWEWIEFVVGFFQILTKNHHFLLKIIIFHLIITNPRVQKSVFKLV
jgi:hypothetical protein